MSRIHTPASITDAPEASRPLLEAIHKKIGVVPNLYRLLANNPAVLEGHLGLATALDKGLLPAATRERIAIAIAEFNGCDYCLSAHSYLAKNRAGLGEEEIAANRAGSSTDPKADAAVRFAVKVARERGHVADADVEALRVAGYADAEIVEITLHVALNTWTNYMNVVGRTAIDFPLVMARKAA
ncbi:putative peroxidase-related enzyme [Bosea sp. BE271]|uniref:carboxymuconolactone decarboxylase family protein n=1 Tax=Bosea TaxID=85413 RepID=UPI002863C9C3|nr:MULTISPECIES: peroxidase-related enzyme [Bosea]MDR6830773.1 putative peroxidase-related enzyme [Bosea robiniae]MDR6895430.1 putative peroxidase-related enzyme [Bosea sp. BE109]MDR7138826.1 putative peroxidase-related enzyme [Bosea sp. BE168]MDR7175527.1 putative peroxidase-related enzyme [Bosea sp. BE271]